MPKTPKKSHPSSVAKAALFFGSGTLTSRILGLIRDALLFSVLPIDTKDAWLAAFRLPNYFRRLLGEGGLSVSFIPIFIDNQKSGDPQSQKALVSGVFTILMSVALLISMICFVFMEPIISYWLSGSGFSQVPGKLEMTVQMARVMVGFLFFICLFAYFMAILNGLKKFAMTGFAPICLNISIICGLYFFKDSPSVGMAAAWSVLIGGALQAFFLMPAVWNCGFRPDFNFKNVFHPLVKKVLQKFAPTFLGVGVLQVMGLINLYFASQLDSGAVTYIYAGDRLLELPLSLIAVSIGTALLPTLSGHWAKGEKSQFLKLISENVCLFYFLAIPSGVGLWFLGADIVDVLFARGEFSSKEAIIVGGILKVYCLTLLCAGSLKIFNQSFYASKDTLTPALISIVGLIVHILMAPRLMEAWGVQGLCLSTALTTGVNLILCLVFLQKRVGVVDWKKILIQFTKCSVAAVLMGIYLCYLNTIDWKQGRFILDFPVLIALIAVAAVIYFSAAYALKVSEMQQLFLKLKRRSAK